MSNSSSKILRVAYEWDYLTSCFSYIVFYGSGAIRKYTWQNLPARVRHVLEKGPCVCWYDGDVLIYEILLDIVDIYDYNFEEDSYV